MKKQLVLKNDVCGEEAKMKLTLHGRQTELLCHIGVLNLASLVEGHAAHKLGQIAGGGDGTATAEGLEDDIVDAAGVLVHADLQLHDIAAGGGADKSGTDILVALLHGANIAGVVVVVQDLLVVSAALGSDATKSRLGGLEGSKRGESAACGDRADAGHNGN